MVMLFCISLIMYLIFCPALFVLVFLQHVHLYQDSLGSEWKNESRNCVDANGNSVVCPYNSNDPIKSDVGISYLPDEPTGELGPMTVMTRQAHKIQGNLKENPHDSNDCIPKDGCERRYFVTYEKVFSMYEAKSKCENMGMRLVSIEHEAKWKEVVRAIKKAPYLPDNYWTSGMRKARHLNVFIWGTGCRFEFENWGENQPDQYKWDEGCVEITKDLTWNDFPCEDGYKYWEDYKKAYICESKNCI